MYSTLIFKTKTNKTHHAMYENTTNTLVYKETYDSPVSARSSALSKSASTIANLRATYFQSKFDSVNEYVHKI